jgi:glycosyltransferase involved in cell wall biosynthesis
LKKNILHIIQDFNIGGAETAVVGVLKNLSEYNNIVVTLKDNNQFGDELKYDKYYSLNVRSYYLFFLYVRRLKKIIKENNIDLVHSQLYWSTIVARLACPKNIPLITSIQASLSDSVEYKKKWIQWLDRITYKKRKSIILGVSKFAQQDYFKFLKITPFKTFVLYNYVDTKIFNAGIKAKSESEQRTFKLITVGNLKMQKNQLFLLKAFNELKNENILLDIYGNGELEQTLQNYISKHDLPVTLKGKVRNMQNVITQYDLLVMPSLYEGFSLAVLEGMASGIPLLLSNIPTFAEQCEDTAEYFELENTNDLVTKIKLLKNQKEKLNDLSVRAKERVLKYFTFEHHMQNLRKIYSEVLNK